MQTYFSVVGVKLSKENFLVVSEMYQITSDNIALQTHDSSLGGLRTSTLPLGHSRMLHTILHLQELKKYYGKNTRALPCKGKRQYQFSSQVSTYCLLPLHTKAGYESASSCVTGDSVTLQWIEKLMVNSGLKGLPE